MNGVDAVVIATGNDWRGVEAGAHAFAAAERPLRPARHLARRRRRPGDLVGQLEMPMALGTVGGTLQAHPGARLAQKLLGVDRATTLAMIVGSAGLASNLAALRALATEGIQRGHMALHRAVAARRARPANRRQRQSRSGRRMPNDDPADPAPRRGETATPTRRGAEAPPAVARCRDRPMPLARSAARPLDRRARVRLLRGVRARPHRELPGGVALRAAPSCARTWSRSTPSRAAPTTSPTSPQYEGRRIEALDRWEEELAALLPRRGRPPGVHRARRHHREARPRRSRRSRTC